MGFHRLPNSCKYNARGVNFVFSGICQTRNSVTNRSAALANTALRKMCKEVGWLFLSNDHITQFDLVDQVQPNSLGKYKIAEASAKVAEISFRLAFGSGHRYTTA